MGIPPDLKYPHGIPNEKTLHSEIERVGKRVFIVKLFHRFDRVRGTVFQRQTVNGNVTEAKRVRDVMVELHQIAEGETHG